MGSYATTTSISELLPQFLAGNTTTSDTAGVAIFSRHIDRAEGVVNSYCGARYDMSGLRVGTTTTNVPPMVRTLTEDLASYYAMRGSYVQDGNQEQKYLDKFESAMATLKDIRDGDLKLALTSGALLAVRSGRFISSTQDYSPVFDLDDPESWAVDKDKLDDMQEARE